MILTGNPPRNSWHSLPSFAASQSFFYLTYNILAPYTAQKAKRYQFMRAEPDDPIIGGPSNWARGYESVRGNREVAVLHVL